MRHLLLMLSVPACIFSCSMEDDVRAIWFDNRSDDTVWVYMAMSYYGHTPTAYPDTLLPRDSRVGYRENPDSDMISSYIPIVPANSKLWIWDTIGEQGDFFRNILPSDTLSIFVMSNDSVKKYSYDGISKENNILVRYDLGISDMHSLDFTFPYPPSPQMRDMKMYPSYEKLIENNF